MITIIHVSRTNILTRMAENLKREEEKKESEKGRNGYERHF